MIQTEILSIGLQLLPEKAIYVDRLGLLLVSDIHLGKSETFQTAGIPIANTVNQTTLDRLQNLCLKIQPKELIILGDLLHSKSSCVDTVLTPWHRFLETVNITVRLLVGNHDRPLVQWLQRFSIECETNTIQMDRLLLSHEPSPQPNCLNICGHIHPCLRLKTRLDQLRLPCFYWERSQNLLVLPSFGEFTGGYDIDLKPGSTAYVVADGAIVPFEA
jgi:DNA ligase-associated metallophosphoesterase